MPIVTEASRPPKRRFSLILIGGIAGLAVGLAAVYGIATLRGNAGGPEACQPAVALAKKIAPLATGQVAAVQVAKSPLLIPNLAFKDAAGKPLKLADFHGRTVLLNLWATWCVPCRKEMPTLDALEAKLGGPDFQVVAVNIDTRDPDKPKRFLKDLNITKLAYYADPDAKAFQDLKAIGRAFGLPTTVLVDPHGCEIGSIAGPAEWASDEAVKLIQAALGRG
jgi:thiol-disulfide isomerase/thioredoxin